MSRVKISLEFKVRSTPSILYNFLSTPSGLAQWFAEHVDSHENTYSFYWNGQREEAEVLDKEENTFIRFQMEENEEGEFLEFRITQAEITGDTVLLVTDFADDDDVEDQKQLWDSQIDALISRVGG
ncbi:MAG: START-like domain-containing protein [Chitinophagales bacterium]